MTVHVSLYSGRKRGGFEPLCAAYHVDCLAAIEAAIARGDRAVVSFFPQVDTRIVDLADVASHGDPDTIFFNVNRPEDYLRADELLAALDSARTGPPLPGAKPEED